MAASLSWPYLDKDEILEALFDAIGCPDPDARQRLSRSSDRVLELVASRCPRAVLCSFWRRPGTEAHAGTPTEWLATPGVRVLELVCRCPTDLSVSRFLRRERHPGHHDYRHSPESLASQATEISARLPLGLGPYIEVDTSSRVDLSAVVQAIERWAAA